jgi:hypothetical protein
MNVDTLRSTLQFLTDLDENLEVQARLKIVVSSLDAIVQSPAHPPHQQSLANALAAFDEAVAKMASQISPAAAALVRELGGERFFDPAMAANVRQAVVGNAMTPAVARDFVRKLFNDREAYLAVLNSTNQGVRELGFKGQELPTGSAEMAVMIPREIFKNDLGTFAKELVFIDRLLTHVSETLVAEPPPVALRQLSSSIPTITVDTALVAMKFIGTAVGKFLEGWKKVAEIREILQRLKKIGLARKETTTELTEEITSTVEQVVEESTTEILRHSVLIDEARKNELGGLIRKDLGRLFAQVERGLVVEIRVSPAASDGAAGSPDLDALKVLSQTLQFPTIASEPILLTGANLVDDNNGFVLAGDHKRTTTTKTTTTKKTSSRTTKEQPD